MGGCASVGHGGQGRTSARSCRGTSAKSRQHRSASALLMSESSPHAASRGFSSLRKKLILACPPPNMLGLLSTRLGYLEKQIAVECCKLSPVSTKVAGSTL